MDNKNDLTYRLQMKSEWKRSPPINCTPNKDDIIFQQLSVDDIVGKKI